jgi:SM-20-related protein
MLSHEIIDSFLTPKEAARIKSKMTLSEQAPASVLIAGREVFDKIRRASICRNMDTERDFIESKLATLKQHFEARFSMNLSGPSETSFIVYRVGDGFGRHVDVEPVASQAELLRCRKLSAVIFLNTEENEVDDMDDYRGGTLVIYGTRGGDPLNLIIGLPIRGETGRLVVFRSDLVHEVRPVLNGTRFGIVSWFSSPLGSEVKNPHSPGKAMT